MISNDLWIKSVLCFKIKLINKIRRGIDCYEIEKKKNNDSYKV